MQRLSWWCCAVVSGVAVAPGCRSGNPGERPSATAGVAPAAAPSPSALVIKPALPSADPPVAEPAIPSAHAPIAAPVAPAPGDGDAAVRSPAARRCRVAAVGDSLTARRGGGGGYLRYLEQRCPQSEFVDFGRGGAMVNQMRRAFPNTVLAEPAGRFTHVLVFGGVNDLYSDETAARTPAKIESDLAWMYATAKAHGARVVALTVAPWGGFSRYFNARRAAATRELNTWILAQPKLGTVDVAVDAFSLLSCGDPERLCPRYEPPFKDGLHFGRLGHEALGAALYEAEFKHCR